MLRVLGILVLIALYVSFIVDVVRTPRADARALPKLLWLVIVIILPILGGILWINSLIWLGHKLGGTPLADQLHKVILIVIVVSFIPVLWTAAKRLLTSSSEPRT